MNAKMLGSWLLLVLSLAGCQSASRAICERGDECDLMGNQSVVECTERVEDGISDGRITREEINDCEMCVTNAERECGQILSECFRDCGNVFVEIAFGSGK